MYRNFVRCGIALSEILKVQQCNGITYHQFRRKNSVDLRFTIS